MPPPGGLPSWQSHLPGHLGRSMGPGGVKVKWDSWRRAGRAQGLSSEILANSGSPSSAHQRDQTPSQPQGEPGLPHPQARHPAPPAAPARPCVVRCSRPSLPALARPAALRARAGWRASCTLAQISWSAPPAGVARSASPELGQRPARPQLPSLTAQEPPSPQLTVADHGACAAGTTVNRQSQPASTWAPQRSAMKVGPPATARLALHLAHLAACVQLSTCCVVPAGTACPFAAETAPRHCLSPAQR